MNYEEGVIKSLKNYLQKAYLYLAQFYTRDVFRSPETSMKEFFWK